MTIAELMQRFHEVAANPDKQKEAYLASCKKVVLVAPVYTPEELIHSMGAVPMGAWGGDLQLQDAKKYFPAFICSIVQSLVELGMHGCYDGVSAIVIPSLCDSLKVVGENWKYAVPSIPFIPMTYPQNRKPDFAADFIRSGYERVIADLEKATGLKYSADQLADSIKVYNQHNAVMRKLSDVLAQHPEVTTAQRSDIFKSAWFMLKEEHTALVQELIQQLEAQNPSNIGVPVVVTGILTDAPGLTSLFDEFGLRVVADDVAAESRQYRTDASTDGDPMECLINKFRNLDNCSVLYDPDKKRIPMIVDLAKQHGAKGIIFVLTKFCDPEEFDYPLLKKACEAAGMPLVSIEADRQMVNYEQARTLLETFVEML